MSGARYVPRRRARASHRPIWTGPRARERSLKQRGGPRRCPVCHLARLGLDAGRPADLFAFEVGPRAAGLEPPPELRP